MANRVRKTAGLVLTALGGGMLGLWLWKLIWLLAVLKVTTDAGSVGIIGGADGPTAIVVTRTSGSPEWLWPVLGALALAGGIFLLLKGKNKKEREK